MPDYEKKITSFNKVYSFERDKNIEELADEIVSDIFKHYSVSLYFKIFLYMKRLTVLNIAGAFDSILTAGVTFPWEIVNNPIVDLDEVDEKTLSIFQNVLGKEIRERIEIKKEEKLKKAKEHAELELDDVKDEKTAEKSGTIVLEQKYFPGYGEFTVISRMKEEENNGKKIIKYHSVDNGSFELNMDCSLPKNRGEHPAAFVHIL